MWYLLMYSSPVELVCQLCEREFKSLLCAWEHFLENLFPLIVFIYTAIKTMSSIHWNTSSVYNMLLENPGLQGFMYLPSDLPHNKKVSIQQIPFRIAWLLAFIRLRNLNAQSSCCAVSCLGVFLLPHNFNMFPVFGGISELI